MSKKIIDITSLERFSNNIKNYIDNSVIENASTKQDKLVSGTNIKTINGESILGEGDLTVEGSAKVYTWNWDGEGEEYILSQEEYDNIVDANIVVFNIQGIFSCPVSKTSKEFIETSGECTLRGSIGPLDIHIIIVVSTKLATLTIKEQEIPTKTSDLENDSNFVSSDNLKTINGQSIIGSGDLIIEGGSSEANVAAVDTGDIIDDVTINYATKAYVDGLVDDVTINYATKAYVDGLVDDVTINYATKAYVDGLVGDINSVLENIINGN
jgi:hypothetical protein